MSTPVTENPNMILNFITRPLNFKKPPSDCGGKFLPLKKISFNIRKKTKIVNKILHENRSISLFYLPPLALCLCFHKFI